MRPEMIVASGGDGTISAVASAVAGDSIVLGVLPTGTANVLARELGIPLDVALACDVLASGHSRSIDAMRVGDRRCLCRLGFGRLAEIGSETTSEDKQASKHLAYMRAAIPRLFAPDELELELVLDGRTIKTMGSSVVVTSVNSVGLAGLAWDQDVHPDDGVIDVIVVDAVNAMDHLGLLWGAIAGGAAEANVAQHLRARESISIRAKVDLPAVADGEPITGRFHQIDVCARSVHVCVPAPSA